ncbi:ABC transporter ATP-binding protein/permease [Ruminococcus sp. FMB-CY1]|uniref:ABC transporter ATP-binding protein n=1 Tax=unclassified Ruminococcus TaxID=2608920 RepID=UPI00208EADB0|nr:MULTISPECIES: ABC transporter ATP-binding protein [unclassified Ruminococcus]USP70754.1 ABC transporter ATP-binding protein [Ruminococcus sp. FMBCY1]WBX58075.1 ABC transporter ATP-binding protein/permease [Ruminococcus sp. FMB-CY1]
MLKILNKFFDFCGSVNKKKFQISIVLGVIQAVCEAMKIPAIMIVLMDITDNTLSSKTVFLSLAIMFVSITVDFFVRKKSAMLQTEAGYNAAANKRIEIAQHLRYLPMGYFNKNSLGSITSVATNTMENLGDVATRVVMMSTQGILNTALIIVMLLCFDFRIGLIATAGVILFFVVNSLLQKAGDKLSAEKVESDQKLVSEIMEYVQGIAEVKSYNLFGKQTKKLNKAIDNNVKVNTEMEFAFIPYMTIQNIITKLTGAVMMFVSVLLYLNGSMSLMICIGMTICAFMLYSSLEQAGSYSALLRTIDICIDKAQKILDLDTMDIDGKDIIPQNYDIDVNNIEFSYDKRKIIDGISLHIPQKTTTAVVGPSGGGKSTLCNLISRFWDVDGGNIRLGGIDVREYSMDSLMKNFSFVFQNVYLFADTIANNIAFGRENATREEIVTAAKKACCHDFIMSLPDGYDTVIGEGGASISGGEKQRISIARAIMKNAPIIILDEATANVDPENEKELVEAIDALTKEKTIIMIAHRLKTVRNADQIVVVDSGKIAQLGTHTQLMQEGGIYKNFVNARQQAAGWKINA